MKTLIRKYADQIPDYEKYQEKLDLPAPADDEFHEKIKGMIAMTEEIDEWKEPVKRGRRTYDDKAFVESVKSQYEEKGSLSERQVAAFGKVIAKYKDQIDDFESKSKKFGLEEANKGKDTGVTCPDCGKANLVEKKFRGRSFIGCSAYPKCKFSAPSLDKVQKSDDE